MSKIALRLKKVCCKVSLCENCQRQSCKAFIGLTIRELPIRPSVNWTFFARCYGWEATGEYRLKIGDFAPMGVGWPKISDFHQPFFFSEN